MDQDSHTGAASKVPMLKPGQFELYRMRIEQYIWMIDHVLWEVIENGNTAPKTTVVEGVEKVNKVQVTDTLAGRHLKSHYHKDLHALHFGILLCLIPSDHHILLWPILGVLGLGGYDWSNQADEGPNYALMAYSSLSSDSEVSNNLNCSKSCLKTVETLKSQYDKLHKDFKKSELIVLAYKLGLESVEEKLEVYKANKSIYSQDIKVLKVEIECKYIAIRELRKRLKIAQKEKDGIQFNVDKFENASKCLNKLTESQIIDNCKKGLGYNVVPRPYTGNFMPSTPDLYFTGLDEFVNKPVVENRKSDEEVSKVVRKSNDYLIIEDWVSDSEEENVSQTKTEKKTVKPSIAKIEFVKPKQQEKTARKTIKQVEKHRQNTHSPRGNQRNWNNMMSQRLGSNFEMFNKACYVCGSFDHLQVDCNYHHKQFQKQRMVKPVWNNAQRVNHQNFAKKTYSCAKRNMVPRAVLMKSGLVSINTARQVSAAHIKTTLNPARPMSYLSKKAHSTVKRPIHKNTTFKNSNFNQRVNTVKDKNVNTVRPKAVVNAVKGNNVNVVKASACWVWKPKTKVLDHGNLQMDLQDQGVIDSGCLRHMKGNMSYLIDYEEIDGGYFTFEGNPKGGKIIGKATKDETSGVLKSFITGIENLVDHKVKITTAERIKTAQRNFIPPTLDLSFIGLDELVNEPVVENNKAMSSEEEPKVVRKNDDAPIIEEWVLDDEEEDLS
ncbi:hypothetical protein Tco_0573766 [Tanacetum coccineum]